MGKGKNTELLKIIKNTFGKFLKDDCSRLAAALSFYTLFSLAPLLLIVVSIVGFIYGTEAIQGDIVKQLSEYIGEKSALLVQDLIISISSPSSIFVASAVAVFFSLYGASNVFNHLNISLNRIWNINTGSGLGLRYLLIRKFFLMVLVISTGLFFLLSLLTGSLLNYFAGFLHQTIPFISVFLEIMNSLLSIGTTILAFALIYKYLPDVRTAWEPVIVGSILSASFFLLSRLVIVFYLRYSVYNSVYNAAASLIILLIWLYYSSQILFFGAEFIYFYANLCGKPIKSTDTK